MNTRKLLVVLSLIGLILTALVYLPALEVGFYLDDPANIHLATGIHWKTFSLANVKKLFSHSGMPKRFVANFSLALNYLYGGLEPTGYHLVNMLIHLAVGFALAWTSVLISTVPTAPNNHSLNNLNEVLAAVVASIIFLVHPLNVQAVTYVVQRMTSLATLFSLTSFSCYLMGRRSPNKSTTRVWFVLSALSWILAVGSKEIAYALPLLVVTYEACFHCAYWREKLNLLKANRQRTTFMLLFAAILIIGLGAFFMNAYLGESQKPLFTLTQKFPRRNYNGLERMLTQLRVQIFYIGLLVWPAPSRLNLHHEFLVSRSILEPTSTLIAAMFWIASTVGAILLAVKRPRLGFPLLAYLELHLIESGPIDLELVFEHRMYFPMTALAIFLTSVLVELPSRLRRISMIVALSCALPLAASTYIRNMAWTNPISFLSASAKKSPNTFRVQYKLGTMLGKRGRILEAIPHLERAVALLPTNPEAQNNLGNSYLLTDRPHDALIKYQASVRLDPNYVDAVYNLGMVLDKLGRKNDAITYYRRFISIAPPTLADRAEKVRRRITSLTNKAPAEKKQEAHDVSSNK